MRQEHRRSRTRRIVSPRCEGYLHERNIELLENGIDELGPGEVYFRCDQTFAFDTTLKLKGDGRSFVIIASGSGKHVAKPY
jgi:hypothetical protein